MKFSSRNLFATHVKVPCIIKCRDNSLKENIDDNKSIVYVLERFLCILHLRKRVKKILTITLLTLHSNLIL